MAEEYDIALLGIAADGYASMALARANRSCIASVVDCYVPL